MMGTDPPGGVSRTAKYYPTDRAILTAWEQQGGRESMRHCLWMKGRAGCLVGMLIVLAASAQLVVADGPWMHVTSPLDGQNLTERQVLVNGTASATAHRVALGEAELGGHAGVNMAWVDGNLTMRPRSWFKDEFTDSSTFFDRWVIERDTGSIEITGGNLVLRSSYSYPSSDPMGLIRSVYDVFPSTIDYSAEVRAYSLYTDGYGTCVGMSEYFSTFAVHNMQINSYYTITAFAEGDVVYNKYSDYKYHTWTLDYSSSEQAGTLYCDGEFLTHYTFYGMPRNFWVGCTSDHTNGTSDLSVDYVDVWTHNGTWTSQPYDFGHDVRLEDVGTRWTSTHPQQADVRLDVRTRNATSEWSEWAPFVKGGAFTTGDVRYIQFAVGTDLKGIRSEQATIMASAFVVDYHDPVVSVEVRRAGGEWALVSGLVRWSIILPLEEDENSIEVRATDTSGASNTTMVRVLVDTTRPTGTVSISPKVSPTNDPNVTLVLTAQDKYGVPWMQLSSAPDMAGAVTLAFNGTARWTLERADGEVHVYARFIDTHWLTSEIVDDSLVLDLTPPEGSVRIADDAPYSSTTTVRLDLDYHDNVGIAKVELSDRPDMSGAASITPPQRAVEGWDLGGSDDGPRTVYMRLTDVVGNVGLAEDTIEVYFPKALGAVKIQDGAAFTATVVVSLELEFPLTLRPSRVEVANDPAFLTGENFAFQREMLWILTSGDGPKTVYARFEDYRGIWSLPVSSTIELDGTAPNVTVALEGGAVYTTHANLTATIGCVERSGPVRMWLSPEDRFDLVDPVPYATTIQWTVAGNEADYSLYVQVEDLVGNLGVGHASIHFATRVPQVTLRLPDGPFTNAVTSLAVAPEVTDHYGGVELQLAVDADPDADAMWQPLNGTISLPIPNATLDGTHEVRGRARDAAGLVSAVASVAFTVDRVAPSISIVSPEDGGSVKQNALRVSVEFTAEDPSGIRRVGYSVDGGNWTAAVTVDRTIIIDLPVRGEHTVTVRVTDRAGNEASESTTFSLSKREESPAAGPVAVALAVTMAATVLLLRTRRTERGTGGPRRVA
jgi:hypothetical protein